MNSPTDSQCPVCLIGAGKPVPETHVDSGVTYTLHECEACGVQFWLPFKNPGAEWYERDERYAGRNRDPLLEPTWKHRETISFFKSFAGSVLDVGCGTGNFLHYARARGWRVKGIDFDADAIRAGQEVFKLSDLEVADLAGFRKRHPGDRFDLITFFDVLEHIDNHRNFMEGVRALAKPRGYIAMSMPYGKHAAWLMRNDVPPRHLTRWTRRALRMFLEREGFDLVEMKRVTEGIRFIILKLRFKYGRLFSFGMVDKVKQSVRKEASIEVGSKAERTVNFAKTLASLKDAVIFGIPALVIWVAMLPSKKRYVTLFCIARKR